MGIGAAMRLAQQLNRTAHDLVFVPVKTLEADRDASCRIEDEKLDAVPIDQ